MTTVHAPNPRLSPLVEPWRERAACLHADTEPGKDPFFPEEHDGSIAEVAKLICSTCLVAEPCLAYALEHFVVGVWGGTTTKERAAIRKARRKAHQREAS